MAFLFDSSTNRYIPLLPHHTIGRLAAAVNTHRDKPYISKLHATIEWRGQNWHLKNLGLNGTHLNADLLQQGDSRPLLIGDSIRLAERNEPEFKVLDISPPIDMLWPLEHSKAPQPITLDRYHLLPDDQNPELSLYLHNQQWHVERLDQSGEHQNYSLKAGELVQVNNSRWQLMVAQIHGPTESRIQSPDNISKYEFIFQLSLDEEITQIHLQHDRQRFDLGARSHHYLLLLLARHRADDIQRGLDKGSQGWVYADHLASELGMDITHMNIHIFRARKQFSEALPDTTVQNHLLERCGGKLRFGCDKFKIYKGGSIISQASSSPTISHYELST